MTNKIKTVAVETMKATRQTKRNAYIIEKYGFDASKLLKANQRAAIVGTINKLTKETPEQRSAYYKELKRAFKVKRFGLLKAKDYHKILETVKSFDPTAAAPEGTPEATPETISTAAPIPEGYTPTVVNNTVVAVSKHESIEDTPEEAPAAVHSDYKALARIAYDGCTELSEGVRKAYFDILQKLDADSLIAFSEIENAEGTSFMAIAQHYEREQERKIESAPKAESKQEETPEPKPEESAPETTPQLEEKPKRKAKAKRAPKATKAEGKQEETPKPESENASIKFVEDFEEALKECSKSEESKNKLAAGLKAAEEDKAKARNLTGFGEWFTRHVVVKFRDYTPYF